MSVERQDDFRLMTVVSTNRIAPHMQRLRFVGKDISHFDTSGNLHVRLHIPETTGTAMPRRTDKVTNIVTRYYTIRRIDTSSGWLDIDFVLHEKAGPGCDFARRAVPGDICGVSGPCGLGVKPARRYLLAGDETALPAIARIAETLPPDTEGTILIEIDNVSDRITFDKPPGVALEWLCRGPISNKMSHGFLEKSKAAISSISANPRDHFIWVAGEFFAMNCLRPHLKTIPKTNYICVAYWKAD